MHIRINANAVNEIEYGSRSLQATAQCPWCSGRLRWHIRRAGVQTVDDAFGWIINWATGINPVNIYLTPGHCQALRRGEPVLVPTNCPVCHHEEVVTLIR